MARAEPLRKEPSPKYLPVQTVYAESVPGSSVSTGTENDPHHIPIVGAELPNPVVCDTAGCTSAASKMLGFLDQNLVSKVV